MHELLTASYLPDTMRSRDLARLARRARVLVLTGPGTVPAEWLGAVSETGAEVVPCDDLARAGGFLPAATAVRRHVARLQPAQVARAVVRRAPRLTPLLAFIECLCEKPWDVRRPRDLVRMTEIDARQVLRLCRQVGFARVEHFLTSARQLIRQHVLQDGAMSVTAADQLAGVRDSSNFRRQLGRARRGWRAAIAAFRHLVCWFLVAGMVPAAGACRSEGGSTQRVASSLAHLRTIGDSTSFGTVDGVRVLPDGRLAVLDSTDGGVSLLSRDGRLLFRLGRRGRGPSEFSAAVALERDADGTLLVLDRVNQRLTRLRIDADSLVLVGESRLRVVPGDLCLLRGRVFVLGNLAGNLVHEVGPDGGIVRSFGSDPDPFTNALMVLGRMACSDSLGVIAVAGRTLKRLYVFSLAGTLLRQDSIPGYAQILYSRKDQSVRPLAPAAGFWHETATLNWLDGNTLLVQLDRTPDPGGSFLEGRVLRLQEGWARTAPSWPRVGAIVDDLVYAAEANPFPVVEVYRLRWQQMP